MVRDQSWLANFSIGKSNGSSCIRAVDAGFLGRRETSSAHSHAARIVTMDRVIELDASTGCGRPTETQTIPVETKAAERRPMFRPNKGVKRTTRTKPREPV